MELDILAGNRWLRFEDPDDMSQSIDFDTLHADIAMQLLFIEAFKTGLADVRGAGIGGLVDALEFPFVDATDVPHNMCCQFTERVVAPQVHPEVDTAEPMTFDCELRHLLIGETGTDRDLFESAQAASALLESLDVVLGDGDDFLQFRDGGLDVIDLVRGDEEIHTGNVPGEQHTVSIVYLAACRWQRQQLDAVVRRQCLVMVMMLDLQPVEAQQYGGDRGKNKKQGGKRPGDKQAF